MLRIVGIAELCFVLDDVSFFRFLLVLGYFGPRLLLLGDCQGAGLSDVLRLKLMCNFFELFPCFCILLAFVQLCINFMVFSLKFKVTFVGFEFYCFFGVSLILGC